MEILAPVGGPQQLVAAVRAGADAVYLGAKSFNARQNAANFDSNGLREAVAYCHGRGVKVHVTVNTLITDRQEADLWALTDEIAQAGADAVIVQDLAVARAFAVRYPTIALHASTQMSVHSVDGALQLQDMGFARVVLARELSAREIALIRQRTGIQLECFVHGALCMSVSGQCYLSCVLGGRSGNRGLCAQPCRLDFTAQGRNGRREYALSLKDLSLVEQIGQLEALGVYSAKIEGRMKRPEYVAAAVHACRAALAGQTPDMQTLRAVFSRSGFTDGYFTGARNGAMFGRRSEQDAQAAKAVYGQLAGLYRAEYPGVAVDMDLCVRPEAPVRLTVSDGTRQVRKEGPPPLRAQETAGDFDAARSLRKTGGTPFYLKDLKTDAAPGLYVPPAQLNALRREALEKLLAARSAETPHRRSEADLPPLPKGPARTADRPALRVCLSDASQLSGPLAQAERVHLPVGQIGPEHLALLGDRLVGELPPLTFPIQEAALRQRLTALKEMGLTAVCGHNIASVRLARQAGLTLLGGYGLNVSNSRALAAYRELGVADCVLSMELSARQAAQIRSPLPVGLMAYGRLPLMQLRACPARNAAGCGACRGDAVLTDRTGRQFPLWCRERQYSTLLNADVLYLADCLPAGVDFALLYFTTEDAAQCARVFQAYQAGEKPGPGLRFTRGMGNKTWL